MARLLHDEKLCTGCRTCMMVCAVVNQSAANPKKAALRIIPHMPEPRFSLVVCNQCGHCADVCPNDAIQKRDGVYVINPDDCTACYSCVEECPQNAMFTHPEVETPIKCVLCGECVQECPRSALSIGD